MDKTINDGGLELTPNVLFSAICAVAAAIGPNCEAQMRRAVEAAAREDAAIPAAPAGLRDYFAAQALPTILSQEVDGINDRYPSCGFRHPQDTGRHMTSAQWWAEEAYQIADAMLAVRGAA